MVILKDKHAAITGDRDGVPGPAIEEYVKAVGVKITYSLAECFAWAFAGTMDPKSQKRVLKLNEEYGPENIAILLGAAETEVAGLVAETVIAGDPTYAGLLAGAWLGSSVYYICEDEVKAKADPSVYDEQVGTMEMVMDVPVIHKEVKKVRKNYGKH